MPELPEVETIARFLREGRGDNPPVVGRKITRARVNWAGSVATPTAEKFARQIKGKEIQSTGRRGKFLRLELSEQTLLVHLRMSGDLFWEAGNTNEGPHHRVVFDLEDGNRLVFQDSRKFGRLWLTDRPEEVLAGLGPEPLSAEFTAEWLYQALHKHNRQLKSLLLEQQFIAGLGNIYTDEALHLAHLHPRLLSATLTKQQAETLWWSIRRALMAAIERNGTSFDWIYRGGDYQQFLQVYQRTGEPCRRCGTPIARMVIGQRGTHFCPTCQPLTESSFTPG